MTKLISIDSLKNIDYKKVGLMCGLEIHQQLNTGKLFCNCPCDIVENDKLNELVTRKLRFSLGESGDVDVAAEDEFKKGKFNIYKFNSECACLVELDEEPPKGPNKKALDMVVRVSEMFNLMIFDKLQFMRKLIIDGSVTTGFQRTAIVGIEGNIKTSFGDVVVEGINLEEDSCRNIERNNEHNVYSLDRQGIPLIEITTGPQIKTAEGALETATIIGNVLRSFPETRRGLGTIRQDVNVSVTGGARIEIKGAQNLKLIPDMVDAEIRRQIIHLSILEELKDRGIDKNNFSDKKVYDISKIFEKSESKVIKSNLVGKHSGVMAIKLNKFENILGHELNSNFRFATEISERNKKHFPTIKGLFHSDELPKYGIEEKDILKIRKELKCKELDGFILIANDKKISEKSLNYIFEIIEFLMQGVPTEVRQVDPKGTVTKYMRPMPGAARMYPETDIFEIVIEQKYLDEMNKNIPELYNLKLERLSKLWSLDNNKVIEILDKFSEKEFNNILSNRIKSSQVYNVIFELPKEVRKREKIESFDFNINLILNILKAINESKLNKNNLYKLFVELYKEGKSDVNKFDKYLEEKGLIVEVIDNLKVENKIKEIVESNKGAPFGALMGICMKEFKGTVDGKIISEVLKKIN